METDVVYKICQSLNNFFITFSENWNSNYFHKDISSLKNLLTLEALKKWWETPEYVSCFSVHFLRASFSRFLRALQSTVKDSLFVKWKQNMRFELPKN